MLLDSEPFGDIGGDMISSSDVKDQAGDAGGGEEGGEAGGESGTETGLRLRGLNEPARKVLTENGLRSCSNCLFDLRQ